MRIKSNVIILLILLILSIGAVSASSDIDNDLSVDSFSISESGGAVFDNPTESLTAIDDAVNSDIDNDHSKSQSDEILTNADEEGNSGNEDHNLSAAQNSINSVNLVNSIDSDNSEDFIDGSSVRKANLLGSTDDEDNERYNGPVWYVDANADQSELDSNDHLFRSIPEAIAAIYADYEPYEWSEYYGQLLIKSGNYDCNEIYVPIWGLLIKAVDGPVTITGSGDNIFQVDYYDVFFKGITFKDIEVSSSAIKTTDYASGLHVEDCQFININSDSNGAAINVQGDDTVIRNCNFTNNRALYGGAIYNGASSTIEGNRFESNTAAKGGAIYCNIPATLNSNEFSGNNANQGVDVYEPGESDRIWYVDLNAEEEGADGSEEHPFVSIRNAINSLYDAFGDSTISGRLLIKSGTYEDYDNLDIPLNGLTIEPYGDGPVTITAGWDYVYRFSGQKTKFKNITFADIWVSYDAFETTNWGDECNFENCTFRNIKSDEGSLIKVRGMNHLISNCNFIDITEVKGGAIKIEPELYGIENTGVEISNCDFRNIRSDKGAIYNNGQYTKIEDCSFKDCSSSSDGGAIYSTGENLNIKNSDFIHATANKGGAIYTRKDAIIDDQSSFVNCSATSGGAIYDVASSQISASFTDCSAKFGGAVYIAGRYSEIMGASFDNCSSTKDGGAIYICGGDTKIGGESSFTNCHSYSMGGAIYVYENNTVIGGYSSFTNCSADSNGGAIYINYKNALVDSCEFLDNKAKNGGAIYVNRESKIANSYFDGNSASSFGGSIYNNDNLELSGNLIESSDAPTGKYIYNDGKLKSVNLKLEESNFNITVSLTDDNGNPIAGKTIYLKDEENNTMASFTASDDSELVPILLNKPGTTIIKGKYQGASDTISNAIEFSREPYAGPYYVDVNGNDNNLGSENSPFRTIQHAIDYILNNKCIRNDESIVPSIFIKNGTYNESSLLIPIFLYSGNERVNFNQGINITGLGNVVINGNGSSILTVRGDYTNISNICFANGNASSRAPVCVDASNSVIDNCSFINNTGINGGALLVSYRNNIVNNSKFFNNSASNGGAIYLSTNNATVSNCEFDCNNASGKGGSIYNEGYNTTLISNTIRSSTASDGMKIYNGRSLRNYNVTVLNNSTKDCPTYDTRDGVFAGSISIPVTVTDDMGNEISGGYINLTSNGEKFAEVYVSEGSASATFSPNKGEFVISAEYPSSGTIKTGVVKSNVDPYTGIIYVHPDGDDSNPGSFHSCVKSMEVALQLALSPNNKAHEIWLRGGEHNISKIRISSPVTIHGLENDPDYGDVIVNGNGDSIFEIVANDVNITNIKFINSSNAIYITANNTHIENSKFDNAGILADYDFNANILIDSCSFANDSQCTIYSYSDNATIRNSNFTDIHSNGNGGALILYSENSTIDNCIFTNCSCDNTGGAVHSYGENINITGSKFINTSSGSVGAVYLSSNGGHIDNCSFENCSSSDRIGAVRLSGSDSVINNCSFTNVSSAKYGAIEAGGRNIVIANSTFNDVHSTKYDVGAIHLAFSSNNATIVNCTFNNVSAQSDSGAIEVEANNVSIDSCSFTDVNATHDGGGVITSTKDNTTIEGCNFTNVHAGGNGGAISLFGKGSSVDNCNFTNSSSDGDGGALRIAGADSSVDNCNFVNISSGRNGGAVYGDGDNINITDSKFINTSGSSAGAVDLSSKGAIIDNCSFENSSSASNIGAIRLSGDDSTINNCSFSNVNSSRIGAIEASGRNIVISNSTFNDVHSTGSDVGAIYLASGNNSTIANCTFNDVSSKGHSGAIKTDVSNSRIDNCNFTDVNAQGDGGAIKLSGSNSTLSNSGFTNTKGKNGGAISIGSNGSTVSNCSFNKSDAMTGGAIYISGTHATVANSSFTNTSANSAYSFEYSTGEGGAIYSWANYTNIDNCSFEDSRSSSNGGAIRLWDSSYSNVSNCNFTGTQAYSGSAIAALGNNMTIQNIVSNHSSSDEWGAISIEHLIEHHGTYVDFGYSNNVTLNNVTVDNSETKELGGGIYLGGKNIVLNNSAVKNSKAYSGGGIYWTGQNLTIENTAVSNNNAVIGAGVFLNGKNVTLKNSNVTYNHASLTIGGVAYSNNITKIGSIIQWNTPDNEPENNYSDSLKNINKTSDILESENPYGSEEIPWDEEPQVLHSEMYLSYFIPLDDGSIGFCTSPYRMRVDERDDLLPLSYADTIQQMVLRAVSSGSGDVLLVNNSVTKEDISYYVKYLFYQYGDNLSDKYLQELYTIFLTRDYRTATGSTDAVTNALRNIVNQVDNNHVHIANSGASKNVTFNGKKYIRYFDFSKLVNMASWKQDVLSVMVKDIPLIDINVNKTWIDNNNQDGVRPGSVTVMLFADRVNIKNITLSADNGWNGNFTDLPSQKNNGAFPTSGSQTSTLMQQARTTNADKIDYIIQEKNVTNYTANVNKVSDYKYNIVNNHTPLVTSVNVSKVWDDDNNRDGLRTQSITVMLYDITNESNPKYLKSITISAANDWKGNFSNLPVYKDNGTLIKYNISEASISGYSINITPDGNYRFIINNTHTPKRTSLNVSKDWDDNDNQDGVRPPSVTVYVLDGDVVVATVVLNESNGWKASVDGLPVNKNNGTKIDYSIKELDVDNYTVNISPDGEYKFIIKNNHTPLVTSLNVSKVWDDNDNQDGVRPPSVTVYVLDGDVVVATVVLNASNNWNASVDGLPVNKNNGTKIDYSIKELDVDNYTVVISPDGDYKFVIKNNHTPLVTSLNVSKVWDDNENQDGVRPDNITVNLYDGDVLVATAELNADNDWKVTFEDLPVYKDNGTLIVYSVEEIEVSNYTVNMTKVDDYNFLINNTHVPLVTSVNVSKVWDDKDNKDKIRPKKVMVELYADGELLKTVVLSASNAWKATFDNLPLMNNGTVIKYTLKEVPVEGYTYAITGDNGTYVITNTHVPHNPKLMVEKITLTPKVKVGKITSFKIRVTNMGDCDLANVYVKELKHIGLVYDHFTDKSGKWVFDSKSKWTFKGVLAPGESAEFIVYFKTTKLGNFTNIIAAGSNETNETTTNNTTKTFDNDTPHKNPPKNSTKPNVPMKHLPTVGNPMFALMVSLIALFVPIRFRKNR